MTKNFKNNTLTDSLVSGAAAIALIAGVGIAATPAQASTLGWDNGTDDFFSEVGNTTFDIVFSPLDIALISNADGIFVPPFQPADATINPPYTTSTTATGVFDNFVLTSGTIGSAGATGTYQLDGDLTFTFPSFPSETSDPDVSVTWEDGTEFTFLYNTDDSVEFEASANQGDVITLTGIDVENQSFLDETFEFSDGSLPAGGEYLAEVEYDDGEPVPEPGTILGLLAIGGLGLGLKRKKQSKQLSA